jgi:hypothetical protein
MKLFSEYIYRFYKTVLYVSLRFHPQEQFFSHLAAVTITGDRAANLDA